MNSILAQMNAENASVAREAFGILMTTVGAVLYKMLCNRLVGDSKTRASIERDVCIHENGLREDERSAALPKRAAPPTIQCAAAMVADALKRLSAMAAEPKATNVTESAEKLRELLDRLSERFRAEQPSAQPDSRELEGKIEALVRSLQSQDTSKPEPPTKERVSELVKKIREALQDFEKLLRGE